MKWKVETWSKRGVVGCLFAAVLMFGVVNYPAAVSVAGTSRQLPIYCVQRDQKLVSISFDAAWGDARVRHIFIRNEPVRTLGVSSDMEKMQ